ncbi:YjjI family glycine radical enzyme [Hydrogenoanaerobacterium sp.]|uniref:YjjI family glycine radical enzyme n=1 Tax=Hydrogenoanaerobacterium sp. TaxID=2953763 RepID=UPI00289E2588|nr:YjjI family glycine radical enzyme [Hydrogenoanaerobacterium sp.]
MSNRTYDVLTSKKQTYRQKIIALAREAENSLDVLNLPERFRYYFETRALCDMGEGNAPYRPRYVMVDFEKFLRQGSKFLKIDPPKDLNGALTALQIIYYHTPSITTMPVYLGNLDKLIDPFLDGVSDEDAKKQIKNFLNYIDRTVADGYCHANLGPEATRAGRLILELEQELQNAVPNFTLKYDPEITPDDFAELAIKCSLACSNPAICNDKMNRDTYPGGYGISSCYNLLPIGGGAYTLSRVVIPRLAKLSKGIDDFLENVLPDALAALGEYMNERIAFLVEKSGYFESDFMTQEGLVERERFVGMYGVAGLCDGVNYLLQDKGLRYGHDEEANLLAEKILTIIDSTVKELPAKYSEIAGGHFMLHAQAGLSDDVGVTSGVRIVVGDEPENILDHLRHSTRYHRFFPTGCSDIFPFDTTASRNPAAVLDIVKGAFKLGDRYCAFYGSDSDLVRITGYLVKRSELQKYDSGEVVLHDTVQNGSANYKLNRLNERKVRNV